MLRNPEVEPGAEFVAHIHLQLISGSVADMLMRSCTHIPATLEYSRVPGKSSALE